MSNSLSIILTIFLGLGTGFLISIPIMILSNWVYDKIQYHKLNKIIRK